MEWLFLLVTYLPIVSIVVGFILLIAGLAMKKTDKKKAARLLKVGGLCIGICLLVYASLFLIGATGVGPVPNKAVWR